MRKKKTDATPPADKERPRRVVEKDIEMGKRLRLRRNEIGMSQDELGSVLGVSFQQVQKYEKGTNRLGAVRLEQIAKALDVPVTFFFDTGKRQIEVESLLFTDSVFSLRLLKAYSAIPSMSVKRQFVALMEHVAGIESKD